MEIVLILSGIVSVFLEPSWSFNLNVVSPVHFKGRPGSYFGYSVALHRTSGDPVALIGSPKSDSASNWRDAKEPGALFKCPLSSPQNCQEVVVDSKAAAGTNEVKDGMWLGMSLSTNEKEGSRGDVLACAPRLIVKYAEDKFYGNGMCLYWDRDLNQNSTKKLSPLGVPGSQTEVVLSRYLHKYAFGQMGLSAYIDQETGEMLMGAPGLHEWSGGIVQYPEFSFAASIPTMPAEIKDKSPYIYAGYSITSGLFLEHSKVQYALGSPRSEGHIGQVYICELSKSGKLNITSRQSGSQVGEYFGASVLAVNLNRDKYADLVVGAPMFTTPGKWDVGRIHVYISSGVGFERKDPCTVSELSTGSRFGSALAALGDLNNDGYQDFAVGAPYDKEQGTVYVFFGSDAGFVCDAAQVIRASDVNTRGPGFGISISPGLDIDKNNYPDVLIGSYGDSSAVLLKSRPVIQVAPKIVASVRIIDMTTERCALATAPSAVACFTVNFHINYDGKSVPPSLTIRINVTLDREVQERGQVPRGFFEISNGKIGSSFQEDLLLNKGIEKYVFKKVFIQNSPVKYNSPMTFFMTYEIKQESAAVCVTCPIVDRMSAKYADLKVPFNAVCGHGGSCKSDLLLEAAILEQKPANENFVIGIDDRLTIRATVRNRGESAYEAKVMVELPSELTIINMGRCFRVGTPVHLARHTKLECPIGNPFGTGETHSLEIKLDTSKLHSENQTLQFILEVLTTSETQNATRNVVQLDASYVTNLALDFMGFPDPETLVFNPNSAETIEFKHTYRVKALYTEIRRLRLEFFIPGLQDGFTTVSTQASGTASCSSGDSLDEIPPQRRRRSTEEQAKLVSEKSALSCEDSVCKSVTCLAGPISRTRSGDVAIHVLLNLTAMKSKTKFKLQDIDDFTSRGEAFIHLDRVGLTTVKTKLAQEGPLPAEPTPAWAIAVGVVGGLLLLLLIILALYKAGFFKRRRPDREAAEQRTSKLIHKEPPVSPEDEERSKALL